MFVFLLYECIGKMRLDVVFELFWDVYSKYMIVVENKNLDDFYVMNKIFF